MPRRPAWRCLPRVFIDGVAGNFDTQPYLTRGCSHPLYCVVLTPFGVAPGNIVTGDSLDNFIVEASDGRITGGWDQFLDTGRNVEGVYAVWSRATSVPEPNGLALLGVAGLGMLLGRRRRRNQ